MSDKLEIITHKVMSMPPEKRTRVINAAMREFSSRGYKNASTNEIVKNAGISKGLLFFYFESKKGLYEFLYRYSIDFLLAKVEPHIRKMPSDIFKRWAAWVPLKIEIAFQHPDMAEFMQSVYRDKTHEIGGMMRSEFERFSSTFQQRLYEGIDLSAFRPEIDTAKAFQLIWWVLEGYALMKAQEGYSLNQVKDEAGAAALVDEMNSYLGMLKSALYKEEFLN